MNSKNRTIVEVNVAMLMNKDPKAQGFVCVEFK